MSPIESTLKRVGRRMAIQQWFHLLAEAAFAAIVAASAALILMRLMIEVVDPLIVAAVLTGVALVAASATAYLRRPKSIEAALEADKRLGLNERITSSLQLGDQNDGLAQQLHQDAQRHAAGIVPTRDFPFQLPHRSRAFCIALVAFGCLYLLMPEFDLLGFKERQAQAAAEHQKKLDTVARIEEVIEPLKESAKLEADNLGLDALTGDIDAMLEDFKTGKINEKQVLAKLMNKAEALAAQQAAMEQAQPKMSVNPKDLGQAAEVAEQMQQGNFGKAAEAMKALKEKMESGEMTEQQKQELAQDLKKLSESMSGESGAASEALKQALAKAAAGLESGDMEGMSQAMEMAEMSMEDLESAMEQMDKLKMAQMKMGQACEQCEGGNPGMGQGLGMGQGQWGQGDSGQWGNGMGNPGRGRGGEIGELPDVNTGLNPSMLPGGMEEGPMLATITETAPPDGDAGEATINFGPASAVQAQQDAERALAQEEIPPGAREFVRQYFGTMEQQTTGESTEQ